MENSYTIKESLIYNTLYVQTVSQNIIQHKSFIARQPRAKFWPDCAIPDTSMKFGTIVDHD